MAKLHLLPVLAAVCFAALAGAALATPKFVIEGRVYCDTCRAGFETSATQYVEGASVKLECRHFDSGTVEHHVEGLTNSTGTYHMEIEHSHAQEICEVMLVKSPLAGCSEVPAGRDRARVLVTGHSGLATAVRYANSLGFLKEIPLPLCGVLLQQYALGSDD